MSENSGRGGPHKGTPGAHESGAGGGYDKLRVNPDERGVKWRFHRGADQRWRWQKLAADQTIMSESRTSFTSYSECLSDAASEGYRHPPSPAGLTEPL